MMWCKHDYVARDKKIIQQPLKSQRKCIKTLISHRRYTKYLWILAHSISQTKQINFVLHSVSPSLVLPLEHRKLDCCPVKTRTDFKFTCNATTSSKRACSWRFVHSWYCYRPKNQSLTEQTQSKDKKSEYSQVQKQDFIAQKLWCARWEIFLFLPKLRSKTVILMLGQAINAC